jgi:hypothetical protein
MLSKSSKPLTLWVKVTVKDYISTFNLAMLEIVHNNCNMTTFINV